MHSARFRSCDPIWRWCLGVIVMCIHSLAGVGPATAGSIDLGGMLATAAKPAHASSVVEGPVRFQVLTPMVVRMEFSRAAHFCDAPSVTVLKRDWPSVDVQTRREAGWLEIDTASMILRYRLGSGPFTVENLMVRWRDAQVEHVWKPGDKDDRNLGGVPAPDIAWRTEPGAEPGPLSRNGYFLLDDSHTAVWDSTSKWVQPRGDDTSDQDWYFFAYRHDYKRMLTELAELLGPIPMIPRYILGTWVGSRAGYSADEWKMIGDEFREKHVPADIFVLDSDSVSKVIWAGYDEDPEQMPDPQGFFRWARENGFHVTTNEHYGALTPINDHHFEAIRELLSLPPSTKEIDHNLADKNYAEAFMDLLHRPRLEMGMAFWWQDGWAKAKMPGLDSALWTRHIEYEGSEQITGRRAFDFCRLGTWGSHRYGGFFTGDLIPYWSTLDLLVPFNVRSGNMLVDYAINLSSGVFQEIVDPELYQRWVEFSAFSPVFWWHGLWGLRFPWEYGAEGLETTRKFLELRYRLLPYTYTYTRLAHDTGLPLVRGMYLDYPSQEGSYKYQQQYLFGQELLVAPITEPGYGEPVLKDVYLPAGDRWVDYFTGKTYQGDQVIPYLCPLDRMPIFIRAGSILPMAPDMDYSGQRLVDPLIVDVYAGKPASFRLYEDDGASLDYRSGSYAWTPLVYTPEAGGGQRIEMGPSEGKYHGQAKGRRYELRVHGLLKPHSVKLGGHPLLEKRREECGGECTGWVWDKLSQVTTIRVAEPISVDEKVTINLSGAGTFEDAETLQKVLDYRERIRKVKEEEKLKWGMVLHGMDIRKPPRVIRETEAVELELDNLVLNPLGIGQRPPNFRSMTDRVLKAFVESPYESRRVIPDSDPEGQKAAAMLESAKFQPEEIRRMTAELLGCELLARVEGTPSPLVDVKLAYDGEALGAATVTYDISLPEEGQPGWIQRDSPQEVESGYTRFSLMAPFLARQGGHPLRVKATLAWQAGQTEIVRDVVWTNMGVHESQTDNGFSIPDLMRTYRNGVVTEPKKR